MTELNAVRLNANKIQHSFFIKFQTRGGGIKENDGGSEFNYDIFDIL
jgi:hypothetical protein